VIRRPRRVVPATIVAVLLLAAAVLLVWACVQVLLGQTPIVPFAALAEWGAQAAWADVVVLVGGGVLAALGIVLLACAWTPGAPNVLALADVGDDIDAGATRRTVRHAVAAAAGRVDGVTAASAQVSPGRVRATVTTPLRDAGALPAEVRAAVGDQLTALALRRAPRISVRVNQSRST
jgi:hypothetical protein